MLSNHEQAEAYAFLTEALVDLDMLLNGVEPVMLDEDWLSAMSLGKNLKEVKEILDV